MKTLYLLTAHEYSYRYSIYSIYVQAESFNEASEKAQEAFSKNYGNTRTLIVTEVKEIALNKWHSGVTTFIP